MLFMYGEHLINTCVSVLRLLQQSTLDWVICKQQKSIAHSFRG